MLNRPEALRKQEGAKSLVSLRKLVSAYDNALAECVIGLFKTEVINENGSAKVCHGSGGIILLRAE